MTIDEQAHLGLTEMTGLANGAPLDTAATAHLDGCRHCQAEARGWGVIAAGVRTVMAGSRPPEEALAAVLATIGTEGGASGRPPLAAASPAAKAARRVRPGWHPAAAAAVTVAVLGGGGLGIAATLSPGARGTGQVMRAALTATSCPTLKLAIGTLTSVSGRTLVIKPVIGPAVRVSTSASTTVTREVNGTLADVRDGMHVIVSGTRSSGQIMARRIGITPSSLAVRAPARNVPALNVPALPVQRFQPALALGLANGTVADAATGSFTVDEPGGSHVRVSTSSSTTVVTLAKVTVAGLRTGERTVAVGPVTGHNALAANTVEQEDFPLSQLGPAAVPLPGYLPTPRLLPRQFPRLLPHGLARALRAAYGRPGQRPSPFPAVLPSPGALFSGLGCNARAIAATGLLVVP
jgi:hypothetical protein